MWKSAAAVYLAINAVGYGIAQQQELEDIAPSTMRFNSPPANTYLPGFDNLLDCEGYLTADPSQNFCSQDVPPDWRLREFNGLGSLMACSSTLFLCKEEPLSDHVIYRSAWISRLIA